MYKKMRAWSLSVVAGAAMLVGVGLAQSTDPLIGTWKLNLAKSKYEPGPAPKAGTVKYEATNQGLKVSVDSDEAGGPTHWGYTANFDGKDYPVAGNPDGDVVVLKRITSTTTEAAFKKSGKRTTTTTRVISAEIGRAHV